MFRSLILLFTVLAIITSSGCAVVKSPVGSEKQYSGVNDTGYDVYARLTLNDGHYTLTEYCISDKGRRSLSRYAAICDTRAVSDPWQSYVNTKTFQPVFSTDGWICSTQLFSQHSVGKGRANGKDKPSCKPAPYWESSLVWGEFYQYLFIIPILVASYYTEIYFDYARYDQAISEAITNSNAADDVAKLTAGYARFLAKEQQEQQEKDLLKQQQKAEKQNKVDRLKRLFASSASRSKAVGDAICSADNRYGYVERISGEKIQIRVEAKARSADYYFFDPLRSNRIRSTQDGRIIWDNSSNWGICSWLD